MFYIQNSEGDIFHWEGMQVLNIGMTRNVYFRSIKERLVDSRWIFGGLHTRGWSPETRQLHADWKP